MIVVQSMSSGFQCTQAVSFIASSIFKLFLKQSDMKSYEQFENEPLLELTSFFALQLQKIITRHQAAAGILPPLGSRLWPESATIEFILTLVANGPALLERGWKKEEGIRLEACTS